MNWKPKTERTRCVWCWWPRFGNDGRWHWWEWLTITEVYVEGLDGGWILKCNSRGEYGPEP